MSHSPIAPQSDLQKVVVEQALAYAQQLEQAAQSAPSGHILEQCEAVVQMQGRQFLRDSLAAALQQQIHEGEKGAFARTCTCGQTCRHKGADKRHVMTSVGLITLFRAYFFCFACKLGSYPLDDRLGLNGFLSKQARRVVCFIACKNSFAQTQGILEEVCGWSISDELIRQVCYREGEHIEKWLDSHEQAYQQFLRAAGQIEVEIDAGKVNTVDGWRDIKMVIFAKREPGEKATPEQWDQRTLPAPTARMAFAKIEGSGDFSKHLGDWSSRLHVTDVTPASVLANGAEWIWNLAGEHFPFAFEVLDVFHTLEHLGAAAKQVHGQSDSEAEKWQEQARAKVLQDGWWGLCEVVGQTLTEQGETTRPAMEELLGYFSKHTTRLNYCARLYAGRTIGSGMVEGAVKNLINKRLKQTKAQWRVENVQKMAVLCCSHYSDTWTAYWTAA